jgi:hypothetical protein
MSSADGNGISLTVILVHVGVDELNDIRTKRSHHDSGESSLSGLVAGEGEHTNERTGGHGANFYLFVGKELTKADWLRSTMLRSDCFQPFPAKQREVVTAFTKSQIRLDGPSVDQVGRSVGHGLLKI